MEVSREREREGGTERERATSHSLTRWNAEAQTLPNSGRFSVRSVLKWLEPAHLGTTGAAAWLYHRYRFVGSCPVHEPLLGGSVFFFVAEPCSSSCCY